MADPGSIPSFRVDQFREFLQQGLQKSGETEGRVFATISAELGTPCKIHQFVVVYISKNLTEMTEADFAQAKALVQKFSIEGRAEAQQATLDKITKFQARTQSSTTEPAPAAEKGAKMTAEDALAKVLPHVENVISDLRKEFASIKESLARIQAAISNLPEDAKANFEENLDEIAANFADRSFMIEVYSDRDQIEKDANEAKSLKSFLDQYSEVNFRNEVASYTDFDGVRHDLQVLTNQINSAIFRGQKVQDERIDRLITQEITKMQESGQTTTKLSRKEHTFLPFSVTILAKSEGAEVLRHMHKSIHPTVAHLPEVGVLGKGGVKTAHKLASVETGDVTHVRSIVHGGTQQEGTTAVGAERAIEAAKVPAFQNDPNLLVGHYVTYTDQHGKKREGFIAPFMQTDFHKLLYESGHEIPTASIGKAFLQVASGLETVHSQGFVHLDINLKNLFLNFNPDEPDEIDTKLADFDLARRVATEKEIPMVGSPQFMAPELAALSREGAQPVSAENGKSVDIFSLGATFYEILQQKGLIEGDTVEEVFANMARFQRPDLFADGFPLPDEQTPLQRLIWDMVNPDPAARPTISEVCRRLTAIIPDLSH